MDNHARDVQSAAAVTMGQRSLDDHAGNPVSNCPENVLPRQRICLARELGGKVYRGEAKTTETVRQKLLRHAHRWFRQFSRPKVELPFAAAILFLSAAAIIYFRTQYESEASAFFGYSPTALADPYWRLETFANDFPNGVQNLLKSLPLSLYPLLGSMGFTGNQIFYVMMPLEVATMAGGAFFATRLLNRDATKVAAILVALYLIGSYLTNSGLGRWWHPFYGSVYTYAYGFALAGGALAITNRLRTGALLLALAIATHPVLGGLGCVFTGLAMLADIRRYRIFDLATASLIGLAVTGAWWALTLRGASVSGADVSADMFANLTQMMSFHLHPISMDVFTERHWERFFPFLSFVALVSLYLSDTHWQMDGLRRQLAFGFTGLLVVMVLGVLFSEYSNSPFLIKLALHRAGSVFLVFSLIVVVPGLWRDVTDGPVWRATTALIILLLPFLTRHGVPMFWAALLLSGALWSFYRERRSLRLQLAPTAVLLCMIIAFVWTWWNGYLRAPSHAAYTGLEQLTDTFGLLLLAVLLVWLMARRLPQVALVSILIAALAWTPNVARFNSANRLATGQDYLAVQIWANENTQSDALFMLDPAHAYGWRAYARRPSFGTVREWLFASWFYNTNAELMTKGIRRFEALGLELNDYLNMTDVEHRPSLRKLNSDVRNIYYSASEAWFKNMTRNHGIDYFVFEKRYLKSDLPLNIVFSNDRYLVAQVSREAQSPKASD